jgi:hypothetical protein
MPAYDTRWIPIAILLLETNTIVVPSLVKHQFITFVNSTKF